ncbi:MAG: ribonuclease HI family protein [Candidatus Woykebacteria bacterium]
MSVEKKRNLRVFCDGGARGNPGPGAAGWVIEEPAVKTRFLCGKYLGEVTNNQAEYRAVELALKTIGEEFDGRVRVDFFLDSKLVANQLSGLYKVKNPTLQDIGWRIRSMEKNISEVYYNYVSREENMEADALVNRAIDGKSEFRIRI